MKNSTIISILILFLATSCSYEPGISEAFTKYRFKDGVTTISIPGCVISMAAGLGDLDESEREILDSIDKVRVLSVENDDLNAQIDLHKEFYEKINKNNNYEELMAVRDDSESVTVFGRMEDSIIKEMVVLVGGDDNVLIYVKGEIRPELINDKVNLSNTEKFLSLNF